MLGAGLLDGTGCHDDCHDEGEGQAHHVTPIAWKG
jgi:hypothetical protein